MNPQRTAYLLQQYQSGQATASEWEELATLLVSQQHDEAIQQALQQAMEQHATAPGFLERDYQAMLDKVTAVDRSGMQAAPVKRLSWLRWVAAAVLLMLMGGGVVYWFRTPIVKPAHESVAVHLDIAPGQQGAVLTLANGEKIVLDSLGNGTIATQGKAVVVLKDGVVSYDKETTPAGEEVIAWNTMSTPRGRQYQLVLPDGSKVWLNAESSISYPVAFTGNSRKVSITGEAYFEVAKDRSKPFIVDAGGKSAIEVLGTHFNINAYADEPSLNTTLLEGQVRVTATGDQRAIVLQPGLQAAVSTNHGGAVEINVQTPDLDLVMAWKNGLFLLQDANLEEVTRQLQRWYDIEVRFEGTAPAMEFQGKMDRGVKLSSVIKWFNELGIHCQLEGKTLIIRK